MTPPPGTVPTEGDEGELAASDDEDEEGEEEPADPVR